MEKVYFKNRSGLKLCGVLNKPDKKTFPVVVFSHGLRSSKGSLRNTAIAMGLLEKKIGSFLFDFSGHGESEGVISNEVISQQVEDLKSAIDFVDQLKFTENIGLNGSSIGGTVAIVVASDDKRIKSLGLRSPPSEGAYGYADNIEIPVLIVQGELDFEILKQSRQLVKHLKKGRLEIIKGASHLYENPEHFEIMVEKTVDFFVRTLSTLRS